MQSNDNNPQLYRLSRRNVLAGLGTIGLASAGAGLGTSAFFSDEESFENNTLTAGSLDLRVRYEASYDSDGAVENLADSAMGEQDGEAAAMFYNLDDVKPGDSGHVEFCFDIVDNPAYMWACADYSESENGMSEPEMDVDQTPDEGELADSIEARLAYCEEDDGEFIEGDEIVSGSLAEVLDAIRFGSALDGDGVAGLAPGDQSPHDDAVDADPAYVTGACICLFWEIPYETVGNEIQTDSLTMNFEFHALQSRHNDGTTNPCAPTIDTEIGQGFGNVEAFDGESSFARGRFGNNGPSGSWEVAVGPNVSGASTGNYVWTPGTPVPFSYAYDGMGTATFTLDGSSVSETIPAPGGMLAITTKADESTIDIQNLELAFDGVDATLNGPDAITASNDGSGRALSHLAFNTTGADVALPFVLSGDVTVSLQGDFPGNDEGVAFDINVQ